METALYLFIESLNGMFIFRIAYLQWLNGKYKVITSVNFEYSSDVFSAKCDILCRTELASVRIVKHEDHNVI